MSPIVFAQVVQQQVGGAGGWRAWTLVDWVIALIVVCAVVAVLFVALRGMGIVLPEWFKRICLIVAVAVVAILAVKLIVSL